MQREFSLDMAGSREGKKTKASNIQARNTTNASYFAPELGRVQPVILFIIVALNINRKSIAAGKNIFSMADRCSIGFT